MTKEHRFKKAYESFEFNKNSEFVRMHEAKDEGRTYKFRPTSAEVSIVEKLEEPAIKWRWWLCVLVAVALLLVILSISLQQHAFLVATVGVLVLLLISIMMAPLIKITRNVREVEHTANDGSLQQFMKTIHRMGLDLYINVKTELGNKGTTTEVQNEIRTVYSPGAGHVSLGLSHDSRLETIK